MNTSTVSQLQSDLIAGRTTSAKITADFIEIYKKDGKEISEDSLRVHMSRLRKFIRNDRECNFLIYHEKDRYKFVRYKV